MGLLTIKTIDSPRAQDTSRSLKIMHCPGSNVHDHAETVATYEVVKKLAVPQAYAAAAKQLRVSSTER